MSQENVEIVRDTLERFLATGEVAWEVIDEEHEIHDHDMPDPGDYRGHAGFLRWNEDWGAAWSDWSLEPQEYIDAGDQVVVMVEMKATGRGSGVEIDREDALVYTLREGKHVRLDYFNNPQQALEAAGLRE